MAFLNNKTTKYGMWVLLITFAVFLLYTYKSTIIDAFTQCSDVPDSYGCAGCQTTVTTNGIRCKWNPNQPDNEKCGSSGRRHPCGPSAAPGPSVDPDIQYSYQNTINTLDKTDDSYEDMTKKQLAEQLSVYGTTYSANSKLIHALYKEMHPKKTSAPAAFKIDMLTGIPGITNPSPLPVYYEPGTYMYNGTGYEPPYSRLMLTTSAYMQPEEIKNAPYQLGGFCKEDKYLSAEMNKKCNQLPQNICASTECCVLLGGQECVAGNEYGPTAKVIYSDFLLKNKDYYYYQGKCYGNCQP